MSKKVTGAKAYKAMKTVVKYCKQTGVGCSRDCIFYEGHLLNPCLLADAHNPLTWKRRKIKRNMKRSDTNEKY